jgi:adenosine deaminase
MKQFNITCRNKFIKTAVFLLTFMQTVHLIAQDNETITDNYFSMIKYQNDSSKINQFIFQMPKGGDIHNHFTGAISVETYFDWAKENGNVYDTVKMKFVTANSTCSNCVSINELRKNARLAGKWSIDGFIIPCNGQIDVIKSSDHFFNVPNFGADMGPKGYRGGVEVLKSQALKENVQYIESMFRTPPSMNGALPSFCDDSLIYYQNKKDTIRACRLMSFMLDKVDRDTSNSRLIMNRILETRVFHQGIDDSLFTLRFLTYVSRKEKSNTSLLKNLYACFKIVSVDTSHLFVGVNIVGREDDENAIKNYWLHMQMFKLLKQRYPSVRIAMHAGELVGALTQECNLKFHIRDAVHIARAERIGHGIDIAYEDNMINTLKTMKLRNIPIEVNLTSNEFILGIGIGGKIHPITLYYNSGVPVVISSDDPGVSKSSLTNEYFKLAVKYPFSYKQMKVFVYNGIKYSFMDEAKKKEITNLLNKQFAKFESNVALTCVFWK